MNLSQRASAEVVFIPSPLGGAGILPFTDMHNVCAVTHGYRLLTCPDDDVRETAWDTLKQQCNSKFGECQLWKIFLLTSTALLMEIWP
jgi:hypothetical protein